MAMAGGRSMRFTLVTYVLETVRTFTPISLLCHGQLVSLRALPLVRPFHRSGTRVGSLDIIAGRSFTPMGSGGLLISARATSALPCRPITSDITRPTALNSVAAAILWSNLALRPGPLTSLLILFWRLGERRQEPKSSFLSTGFHPTHCDAPQTWGFFEEQ